MFPSLWCEPMVNSRAIVIIVFCGAALLAASFWHFPPFLPKQAIEDDLNAEIQDHPLLFFQTLDLNLASFEELQGVPGIGPVLAGNITAYRLENGPFKSLNDLENVAGIGPKKILRLRKFFHIT